MPYRTTARQLPASFADGKTPLEGQALIDCRAALTANRSPCLLNVHPKEHGEWWAGRLNARSAAVRRLSDVPSIARPQPISGYARAAPMIAAFVPAVERRSWISLCEASGVRAGTAAERW